MRVAAGRRGCCAGRSHPTPTRIRAQPDVEEGSCGGLPGVCVWRAPERGKNQPAGGRRGRGGRSDGFTSCWGEAEILNGSRRPLCKPFPTEKKVKAGLKVLPRNLAHRGAQSMDGNSLREGHFSLQANWVPESGCVGVWAIDTAHNH